jgi:hypothetical protein
LIIRSHIDEAPDIHGVCRGQKAPFDRRLAAPQTDPARPYERVGNKSRTGVIAAVDLDQEQVANLFKRYDQVSPQW